jgi:hypothetical protein
MSGKCSKCGLYPNRGIDSCFCEQDVLGQNFIVCPDCDYVHPEEISEQFRALQDGEMLEVGDRGTFHFQGHHIEDPMTEENGDYRLNHGLVLGCGFIPYTVEHYGLYIRRKL